MTGNLTSSKAKPLSGTAAIPGDKSISHRALMLGGLAIGETVISGLLEGEDVLCTAHAMRAMGAKIEKTPDGLWHCHGVGIGGLHEPEGALDMGNSGTSTRLLMGLAGGHNMTTTFTGDASLSKRPMKRVITPLEMMGAKISAREDGRLPLTIKGPETVLPIEYRLPVASAQVKSAVLLAGLSACGQTGVIEEKPTRDYTENMLRHFGVEVEIEDLEDGAQAIRVRGQQDLKAAPVSVPADPSSAAFPVVAAVLTEGSDIFLPNIGMNPRRDGLYVSLLEMGADITFENERTEAGERIADLRVRGSGPLKGIDVPAGRVPSMIDEFPVLAMAAACAEGPTRMTGLAELRVKESDRLLMVAEGLKSCGVKLEMGEDSLNIFGTGRPPKGGACVKTALDHRIAMSFLVLGTVTEDPVKIDDAGPIKTSFPTFVDLMNRLGANIR
ncbi:MAG: 3-phosphoshikimate 1-carboxyvinyltransferase [Rhodospirillales bacterium]|nr:3-phosphoshikimate 1-carboxyvinyltransferase [Alphaproteobacteria bacterium]USO04164.1 MAG: 3-phosphoshikimate 1-carboxyvinyltransferase [Rhodospirillales bacterium]